MMVEKKQLVAPGDFLAEGDYSPGNNTYKEDDRIYASMVGRVNYIGNNIYVIALKGFYMPIPGDLVIGKIVEATLSSWIVDINSPYLSVLFPSEVFDRSYDHRRDNLTGVFDVGDLILAKVVSYDRTRDPILTVREPGLGKTARGVIVRMTPAKIPRLVGRKGSMISMIKKETNCNITAGQNGLILISGSSPELETLAVLAIRKIEEEAHTGGLTNRVNEFISKEKMDRGLKVG